MTIGSNDHALTSERGSPEMSPAVRWTILSVFLVVGFVVRVYFAVIFPTIERPDEIFQNLEPAYRLSTGHGIVTWEWRVGLRSWLFPFGLFGLLRLATLLHLPESAALPLIWASLAFLSCGLIAGGVMMGWRFFGYTGAILCGILTAYWPDLVYFGPKTLLEVQSGNIMVIAAVLASGAPGRLSSKRLLAIGFMLATTFDLRFQLSLSLMIIACWAVRFEIVRGSFILILGAAGPLILLGLVDWLMLGSPFQSIWKNIQMNLLEHKADTYGSEPIYAYLYQIMARTGSACVLFGFLFVYGFRYAKLLAISAISVVAFHSMIPHKEISFIYAALPCAIIVVGLGASRLVNDINHWLTLTRRGGLRPAVAAYFTLAIIVTTYISQQPFSASAEQTALRDMFRVAQTHHDMCGLGLSGEDGYFPLFATGGYVNLRRNVPIYLTTSTEAFYESRSGFNYVIAQKPLLKDVSGLDIVSCSFGYCLFHSSNECHPVTKHLVNDELSESHL